VIEGARQAVAELPEACPGYAIVSPPEAMQRLLLEAGAKRQRQYGAKETT